MIERADELKAIIKSKLKEKRYIHSLNVADEAKKLAEKYGADAEKAYICGLLHDAVKNCPEEEQLKLIREAGIELPPVEADNPKLWHAPAGAAFMRDVIGIKDEDMFNALMYHTTARAGMSILEKTIYIADYISADRDYPGVEDMRKWAYEDIDKAVLEGTKYSLSDLLKQNREINKNTIEAYNDAVKKTEEKQ